MEITQIASNWANGDFLIWLVFFLCVYTFWAFYHRKNLFKGLFYSSATVIGWFTFWNIVNANTIMFGGGQDNIVSFFSVTPTIYFIQSGFLFICAFFSFDESKSAYFWRILTTALSIFLFIFYFRFDLVMGFAWISFNFSTIYLAHWIHKKILIKKELRKIPYYFTLKQVSIICLFAWSLIWVGGYLYRDREQVFDCVLHQEKEKYVKKTAVFWDETGNMKTDLLKPAASFGELKKAFGEPQNSISNYIAAKSEDSVPFTTYFYCPQPFLPIQHQRCEGYRVTVAPDNSVFSMNKRGLTCLKTSTPLLLISPMKDPVYYFFWSADMWSFKMLPSENYDLKGRGVPLLRI